MYILVNSGSCLQFNIAGYVTRGLRQQRRLFNQLLRQQLHRAGLLCHLRPHGPVCTGQRCGGGSYETFGGKDTLYVRKERVKLSSVQFLYT